MFCPFCGNNNREGKKFCRQCGRTIPPARENPGTTPLPPVDEFPSEASLDSSNPSVDESIYSVPAPPQPNWSPTASEVSSDSWRPNRAVKTSEEYRPTPEEIEEDLNQFTQQLLPDTADFEVLPPQPVKENNGREKPTNGVPAGQPSPGPPLGQKSSPPANRDPWQMPVKPAAEGHRPAPP